MLCIACGALKNKHSSLNKIIVIAINSLKHHQYAAQDYILLNCKNWKRAARSNYYNLKKSYRFWQKNIEYKSIDSYEYPLANLKKL